MGARTGAHTEFMFGFKAIDRMRGTVSMADAMLHVHMYENDTWECGELKLYC